MPVHDWTKVSAGDFHDFHQTWTGLLRIQLNEGGLPPGYYAQVEQQASGVIPDVLTLQYADGPNARDSEELEGALAIAVAPPQVEITAELERRIYTERKNQLVIRQASNNRVVALMEVVSSGNKSSDREFRRLLDKLIGALDQGIHLLVVDFYPPTSRDPQGIHGAIWAELGEDYAADPVKPLTLAAYSAGEKPVAFVEPLSVGDRLKDMPLILRTTHYVRAPLESTYMTAFRGSPPHVLQALELRAKPK